MSENTPTSTSTPDVYINGSDLLMDLGGGCIDHCTSHTLTMNTETKDRAVKPIATASTSDSLWKQKGVVGQSVSISGEGLRATENETGFNLLLEAYAQAKPIFCKAFKRGATAPYMSGYFVITSLEESAPAQDDAKYTVKLENSGPVNLGENAGVENPS